MCKSSRWCYLWNLGEAWILGQDIRCHEPFVVILPFDAGELAWDVGGSGGSWVARMHLWLIIPLFDLGHWVKSSEVEVLLPIEGVARALLVIWGVQHHAERRVTIEIVWIWPSNLQNTLFERFSWTVRPRWIKLTFYWFCSHTASSVGNWNDICC